MRLPSLVVFDMAGTTVLDRGQVPAAFSAALAEAGIALSNDQIARVRGASKRQAIRELLPSTLQPQADDIYSRFRALLAERYKSDGVHSIANAAVVFRRLRDQGIKVALNTGFDRDITTLLLSSLGWSETAVDAVVCGDDVPKGRPAPDMILKAMAIAGVPDASAVANVGDTARDLEAGHRAGVGWNIGVLSGAHPRETLERAPHTHIINSIADLPF